MRWVRWFFGKRGSLFGHEHSGSLGLFRVVYCLLVAFEVFRTAEMRDEAYVGSRYFPIPLFAEISVESLPLEWSQSLRIVLVAALVLSALGILTRPALIVSALAFFLYEGNYLGFTKPRDSSYVYHMSNLTAFALLVLATAPHVGRHGLASLARREASPIAIPEWPRKTIIGLVALAYLGAGWCKMDESPLWVDGHTLQGYLFDRAIRHDLPLALQLGQHWGMCVVLSVLTVVLELTFVIVLVFPRLAVLYVLGGLLLHTMILLSMNISFFHYFAFNYVAFIEWPVLAGAALWLTRRPAPPPLPLPTASIPRIRRAWPVALLALQTACVFLHVESWPFSDFRVYSKRRHPNMVGILFVAKDGAEGSTEYLPRHVQRRFQRAIGNDPPNAISRALFGAEEERDAVIEAEKPAIYRAVMETDPKFFKRHQTLRLYLRHVRQDPATGRWDIVDDFVTDLPDPR